ncbi:uncharacterized protein LOC129602275 [Paramacrobiotus metropolitanus]|uniref:uncharacterized protein LOC129602275 n=1 Tax=Paramacrobiotus metropolitanus TaxID=2943436 RepID=UPI002445ACEB|nr:uncharacterized protein LOC129602275 [Paramacrobiotus metropolitanus]
MLSYSFDDQNHAVYAWNAVDVLVDGQLQHGDVINMTEGGLIIDFKCPTKRAQFVKYGLIFHCNNRQNFWPWGEQPAQVVLRRHSDGAWIWYPGALVSLGSFTSNNVELVDIQRPYGTVRELLPWQQVRLAPTNAVLEERRVGQTDFVIRDCPMPGELWSEETPHSGRSSNTNSTDCTECCAPRCSARHLAICNVGLKPPECGASGKGILRGGDGRRSELPTQDIALDAPSCTEH